MDIREGTLTRIVGNNALNFGVSPQAEHGGHPPVIDGSQSGEGVITDRRIAAAAKLWRRQFIPLSDVAWYAHRT